MFDVKIDFSESHWFFPRIIIFCLCCLLVIILIKERQAISRSIRNFSLSGVINTNNFKAYIFVVVISIYILVMNYLSEVFPNTGYSFLISTIPLLFIISFLIEREMNKKKAIFISINSIVSPFLAWLLLGQIFGISLP